MMNYKKAISDYLSRTGFERFEPRAVMFDMDGVLYDSMPNHAYSWHESMKKYGIDMSADEAYAYEGMRGVETIQLIVKQQLGRDISEEEAESMYEEKARVFGTRPKAQIMEGVKRLMAEMKAEEKKILVVTGSGQHNLLDKLAIDFKEFITPDMIVSSFDVSHGKPSPEPYLKGLAKAGVQPWEGVVVENAPLGVRAGVAARVFTIAVNTGPLPDSALSNEGASLVFPRMTELADEWDEIMRSL